MLSHSSSHGYPRIILESKDPERRPEFKTPNSRTIVALIANFRRKDFNSQKAGLHHAVKCRRIEAECRLKSIFECGSVGYILPGKQNQSYEHDELMVHHGPCMDHRKRDDDERMMR